MRDAMIAVLVAAVTLPVGSSDDPKLAAAVKQYDDGLLTEAVVSFDALIRERTGDPAATNDLVRAYLYRGAAFVGLLQEGEARASFREALKLDATIQPDGARFPPRVIRVFEATRKGKSKSALYAGGGIGAVALAAGAVALAAGGGAAVASATTGEAPSLSLIGINGTGFSTPVPANAINSGAVGLVFRLVCRESGTLTRFSVTLSRGLSACVDLTAPPTAVTGGRETSVATNQGRVNIGGACALPFTTDYMSVNVTSNPPGTCPGNSMDFQMTVIP